MKKNFLQDVIPPSQKRSIRDIPLPNSERPASNSVPASKEAPQKPTERGEDIKLPPKPPKDTFEDFSFDEKPKGKKRIWIIAILIIIILGVLFFLNRSGAEIIVYPKTETVSMEESFDFYEKNSDEEIVGVGYKKLSIEKEVATKVNASGEEEVSEKASGTIRIYNEYSSEDQRLVANTRFEAKDGKIYRIAESISVPGATDSGPGEIEATVFADVEGDDYNQEKTSFTIPGFEGLPQFDSVYAESITDLSGGFTGTKKVVSEDDKASALESLKQNALGKIQEEVDNSGGDFIVLFDEEDVKFSNISESDSGDGVDLKITASVNTFVFDINELARFIADNQIPNAPEGEVTIVNIDQLEISIIEEVVIDEETEEEIVLEKIQIKGDVELKWLINEQDLANSISKKTRNEFSKIITNNKSVSKAEFSISPFWSNTFPESKKIEIGIKE